MEDDKKPTAWDYITGQKSLFFLLGSAIVLSILDNVFDWIWTFSAYVLLFIALLVIVFLSTCSKKVKPWFELDRKVQLISLILIPLIETVVAGIIISQIVDSSTISLNEKIIKYFISKENYMLLFFAFFLFVAKGYATLSYLSQHYIPINNIKNDLRELKTDVSENFKDISGLLNEGNSNIRDRFDLMCKKLEYINKLLTRDNPMSYATTCIPVRYNPQIEQICFVLIENETHTGKRWMFPGKHVDVSNNHILANTDFAELEFIPHKIAEKCAVEEAGLIDLHIIDPNYQYTTSKNPSDESIIYRYPNTCIPLKSPVFNYLLRIDKSARCSKESGHIFHYDFTYVATYESLDDSKAKYRVIELSFLLKDFNFSEDKRSSDTAKIKEILAREISHKLHEGVTGKQRHAIHFEELCLDSIPHMIYNAILFCREYFPSSLPKV